MSAMTMASYNRCIQSLRHGRKIGMIIRQIMVKPDLNTAGVNTSARSVVLTVTSAVVVVAHGIIRGRSNVQHVEGNVTNMDMK